LLEHLRAQEAKSGVTPQILLDAPGVPEHCEELWGIFTELHGSREWRDGSPLRISYRDLEGYQRTEHINLARWERRALAAADAAFTAAWSEQQKEGNS
jgi:hypothetical protein